MAGARAGRGNRIERAYLQLLSLVQAVLFQYIQIFCK